MAHLIWSQAALRDLNRLRAFLAPKSTDASGRAIGAIRLGAKQLEYHPEIGRPVEGLGDAYRDLTVSFGNGGYILRYQMRGDNVLIVGIKHAREAGY